MEEDIFSLLGIFIACIILIFYFKLFPSRNDAGSTEREGPSNRHRPGRVWHWQGYESARSTREGNRLDLHGFTWSQAKDALINFLSDKLNEYSCRDDDNRRHIFIITGRGLHSHNGQPVLKPKVEKYLKSNGFSYTFKNPGMIQVDLFEKKKSLEEVSANLLHANSQLQPSQLRRAKVSPDGKIIDIQGLSWAQAKPVLSTFLKNKKDEYLRDWNSERYAFIVTDVRLTSERYTYRQLILKLNLEQYLRDEGYRVTHQFGIQGMLVRVFKVDVCNNDYLPYH